MGAPDLLQNLRGAGFDLAAVADGGIRVSPYSALTEDLRQEIREHRDELLALLSMPAVAEAAHEAFEERVGIREFDGGMPRHGAEQAAAADLGMRVLCMTCTNRSRWKTCLCPVEAGLTTSFEIVWCELLTEAVCPAFELKAA
jgi:hypothetical protein